MKTGVLTDPYGNAVSTSGGTAPALDANHIYVYNCDETSGTTLANIGSGANGDATFTGTINTDYYVGSKIMGRNMTSFRPLNSGPSATGYAVTGNSCSITGGSISVEVMIVPNDIIVEGAADPLGTIFKIQDAGNTDFVEIATTYFAQNFYGTAVITGGGANSTSTFVLSSNANRYHLMLTYNAATGVLYLYVNGILEKTASFGAAHSLPTLTKIYIGGGDASWGTFQGWIAHLRISDIVRSASYALSSAEAFLAL